VISAIEGMAGVGKTRLAIHAGYLLHAERPFDRVLFVNLHDFHPDPTQPPADPAGADDSIRTGQAACSYSFILVKVAAESIMSMDVRLVGRVRISDRAEQRVRRGTLVIPRAAGVCCRAARTRAARGEGVVR